MESLVWTVIGPDRPGLVESLASVLARHGGSWLESRMARLSGQFAGIVQVEVPGENLEKLRAELDALASHGLVVSVAPAGPESASARTRTLELSLVGRDRPGIVRQVSAALAGQDINVEELETECRPGPMSGEKLFHARAQLSAPAALSLATITAELERIADDLMVDLSLTESDGG